MSDKAFTPAIAKVKQSNSPAVGDFGIDKTAERATKK